MKETALSVFQLPGHKAVPLNNHIDKLQLDILKHPCLSEDQYRT